MNQQIRRVLAVVMVLYLMLFARLNIIQVFQADDLNKRDGNTRSLVQDFEQPRGDIVTIDGDVAAHSQETPKGKYAYQRTYPAGDLYAHITGYYGFAVGSTGVERNYAQDLAGRSPELQLRALSHFLSDTTNTGDVVLSIDSRLQKLAKTDLGERRGAVVLLDPRDGAVKTMWSWPSFDPNAVSDNEGSSGLKEKQRLDAEPAKPLLARAFRETYAPGSTFKVVTAGAGFRSGKVTEDSPSYPDTDSFTPPSTTRPIHNSGGTGDSCGGTVAQLLAVSCNTGFAAMGSLTLGPEPMVAGATAFGFNKRPPLDLPGTAVSRFPTDFGRRLGPVAGGIAYENSPKLAFASIGQGDVTASPLQMALVASAVGTDGTVPTPHVVAAIRDSNREVVRTVKPGRWMRALDTGDAAALRRLMVGVVTDGTASRMAVDGWEVGAKTGTAQTVAGVDRSHAWMIAWIAKPGQPAQAAVAVIVEAQNGVEEQTGARVAGPIARDLLTAAVGAQ